MPPGWVSSADEKASRASPRKCDSETASRSPRAPTLVPGPRLGRRSARLVPGTRGHRDDGSGGRAGRAGMPRRTQVGTRRHRLHRRAVVGRGRRRVQCVPGHVLDPRHPRCLGTGRDLGCRPAHRLAHRLAASTPKTPAAVRPMTGPTTTYIAGHASASDGSRSALALRFRRPVPAEPRSCSDRRTASGPAGSENHGLAACSPGGRFEHDPHRRTGGVEFGPPSCGECVDELKAAAVYGQGLF